MKCIIYKRKNGEKPEIYTRTSTLGDAKKILSEKYMSAIEFWYDEIVQERDQLTDSGKELHLFDNHYFIEPDKSLQ